MIKWIARWQRNFSCCAAPGHADVRREPAVFTGTKDAGVVGLTEVVEGFHADAVAFRFGYGQALVVEDDLAVVAVLDEDAEDVALVRVSREMACWPFGCFSLA